MDATQIAEVIRKCCEEYAQNPNRHTACGVVGSVNDAIAVSQAAFRRYSELSLNRRQEIINAVKAVLIPNVEEIARRTLEETGLGNVRDKVTKLRLAIDKTPGIEDLVTDVRTGDDGMTLYELSAYGLVCAVHPCTNPCETLISNTIGILAAGNAVIHIPHPRAVGVTQHVTSLISAAIRDCCGIENLVVTLGTSSMAVAGEIMGHPDVALVVVTGGRKAIHTALHCGKKVIGAGPGNPVAIVDETADIAMAAINIADGASFDHNIMCVSEKCIVVVDSVAEQLIDELGKNGARYINEPGKLLQIAQTILTQDMRQNRIWEGKSACEILQAAGIPFEGWERLVVAESIKLHPFVVTEMLMPVVPLIRVKSFEEALQTALEIEQGYRHTAMLHSQSIARLNQAAKVLQTAVFIKNGSSLAGIGMGGEGDTSFTIATATGEGSTTARHFARRRRCVLTNGFSIR